MRIIYLLFFSLVTSLSLFSQKTHVQNEVIAARPINIGESLKGRVGCGVVFPEPYVPAIAKDITPNRWGGGIKTQLASDTIKKIKIRCGSMAAYSKPLFIIDGKPMEGQTLKDINPNDIESITILKDAAAIAIYGHQAQGGVVIIVTKKTKTLQFEITDAQDGTKLPGASVKFTVVSSKQSLSFSADKDGMVTIGKLDAPLYEMEISAVGYKTAKLNVSSGDTNKKTIMLERNVAECFPVVIICPVSRRRGCPGPWLLKKQVEAVVPVLLKQDIVIAKANIFPNPIQRGQSFNIELTVPVTGTFNARVISIDGRQLLTRSFIAEGTSRIMIATDTRWSAGTYFIQVNNEAGTPIRTEQVSIL
jgi:TonB-dependent SusC/RagA subfamily outer membrane receptor